MQVTLQNVIKKYDQTTVVKDLNLTIQSGSLHFLLGPSGCGKTTTLRIVAGLEQVSSGKVLFNQQDVTFLPPSKRKIGMVFQNYALWPHMTVWENVAYGAKLQDLKNLSQLVTKALELTEIRGLKDRYPAQLSGGQQQRVALSRALALKPQLLLLDEPLSNLDAQLRVQMRERIKEIHESTGITTLYVTHDQSEALSIGTHISILKNGQHLQTGKPLEIYTNPTSKFLASFIGQTNFIKAELVANNLDFSTMKTDFGLIHCKPLTSTLALQKEWTLSLRPEYLTPEVQPNSQTIQTVIQKYEFHGTHYLVSVSPHDRQKPLLQVLIHTNMGSKIQKKSSLKLYIAPKNVSLFTMN